VVFTTSSAVLTVNFIVAGTGVALACAVDPVPEGRVDAGVMRTHEVAERAGVNAQTLRYYERRGILTEPPRSAGGYRNYPASAVAVLRFVKRAQELGFTLAEVEELLGLAEGGPESCDAARTLAQAHIAELERKIADLQRMRASLGALLATCQRPRSDRSCPLLAAMEGDGSLTEVPR
jgi:Hg(II)-responsive transcriptional regulator